MDNRASSFRVIAIPTTMQPTNAAALGPKLGAETMPGPGQNPPRPHPTPKSPAPAINRASTARCGTAEKADSYRGAERRRIERRVAMWAPIAPTMTKAREGSH